MRVGRLNVDENPVTAARFRIRSIPALPMFKGGGEVDRIVGAQPKSEVRRHIGRLIG
jgi:thioredoxin-like negative regulator of GroEL